MPGRVIPKPPAPAPKLIPTPPADSTSVELLDHIAQQLSLLNKAALTGLKALDPAKPAPSTAEAWEFEVIRGSDGRIKTIKAVRK